MKQLTESDIDNMIAHEFVPDSHTKNDVRAKLHLSRRFSQPVAPLSEYATLDFHTKTEDQVWAELMSLATSGVRRAKIITGASGVLKPKFLSWVRDSVLTPFIIGCKPINNGSFDVRFRRQK